MRPERGFLAVSGGKGLTEGRSRRAAGRGRLGGQGDGNEEEKELM